MSIDINKNSYNYRSINFKGRELETTNNVDNTAEDKSAQEIDKTGKVECQTCRDRNYKDVSDNTDEKKDYFFTNYNDTIAKNFGLILDVRV